MTAPSYRALVVTASNRAAAGVYEDKGGPLIAEGLTAYGFEVDGPGWCRTATPWKRHCARASTPGTT